MSAINRNEKNSSRNSTITVGAILGVGMLLLFAYLMWYVAPEESLERVKIIAITESGCVVETMDGYAVNVETCQGTPGQYVNVLVDQKIKERAALMNPTN